MTFPGAYCLYVSAKLKVRLLITMGILFLAIAHGAVLETWTFEDQDPFHHLVKEGEDPAIVPDPLNPKNHVMKAVLNTNSKRSGRSEVRWDKIKPGQERWIGVKILVAEANPMRQSLFQLGPINYMSSGVAGTGYFQIQRGDNSAAWMLRGFLERVKLPGGAHLPRVNLNAGPMQLGVWQSWIVHARISTGNDGILEFWNGPRKVYELKGPNCSVTPYFCPVKWGIYIGEENHLSQNATAYFDNIIIADEHGSMAGIMQALNQ